jgi:hypothetical protein
VVGVPHSREPEGAQLPQIHFRLSIHPGVQQKKIKAKKWRKLAQILFRL